MSNELTSAEKALVIFPFFFVLFAPIGMIWGMGWGAAYLAVTFLAFTGVAITLAIKGDI